MFESMSRARIAVVDDEHIVADTLAEILNCHGFQAKALYSGESAVEEAENFRPQIVLSDVRMGGMDGVETAIRIRSLHPECRIILFTASPVRHSLYAQINLLGFEFIERPLHPREVLALLANRSRITPHIRQPRCEQNSGRMTGNENSGILSI
jgi:DNA-binding response OmpR family regulator